MLGVASDGLVAPSGLLDHPSDLSQLSVNAVVGSRPQRYLLKRRGMDSVRVFLTNVYTLGIADYLAISQAHQDIDAIVTLSGYNTYTPEAKAQALQNGTGLFKFKELMGALHKEDEDEFAAYEPPKKN